jgi:dipeptidyl aminopeptidase/acylaminoacyl peptidase
MISLPTVVTARPQGWHELRGCTLSSVAWSPDGRYIAFVSVKRSESDDSGEFIKPRVSTIWLMDVSEGTVRPRLQRVVRRASAQGIPTALFWVTGHQLAWAEAGSRKSFSFCMTDLSNEKMRLLTESRFSFYQSCDVAGGLSYAPDDVYWDRIRKHIVFGAVRDAARPITARVDSRRENIIGIYDIRLRRLKVQPIDLPKLDGWNVLTFCGSPGSRDNPFYFAAWRAHTDNGSDYGLWSSTSDRPSASRSKMVASGNYVLYPRLSQNHTRIAWVYFHQVWPSRNSDSEPTNITSIVVQSIKTGKLKVLEVSRVPGREDMSGNWLPRLGCPFSWSPDGKTIAYAHGEEIRIARL